MARQRNNVAVLPFEVRKMVCRMLLDGRKYADIDAAAKAEYPEAKTLHSTTLIAYAKSQEYKNYSDGRMKIEPKLAADRWAADALRECAGIEVVSDMAEMALLKQLRDLAEIPGNESDELVRLTKAVCAIKRTKLAGKDEEHKQEIKKLNELHTAKLAEKDAIIAELSAKITEMSGGPSVDSTAVQDNLDKVLGVKK